MGERHGAKPSPAGATVAVVGGDWLRSNRASTTPESWKKAIVSRLADEARPAERLMEGARLRDAGDAERHDAQPKQPSSVISRLALPRLGGHNRPIVPPSREASCGRGAGGARIVARKSGRIDMRYPRYRICHTARFSSDVSALGQRNCALTADCRSR